MKKRLNRCCIQCGRLFSLVCGTVSHEAEAIHGFSWSEGHAAEAASVQAPNNAVVAACPSMVVVEVGWTVSTLKTGDAAIAA